MDPILVNRFNELKKEADNIEASKIVDQSEYIPKYAINGNRLLTWRVKVRNLISIACGQKSEHYIQFLEEEKPDSFSNYHDIFLRLRAVFSAAKEDFEGGYLITLKNLIQAEVFSTELDQARELLESGYLTPAAVVAGVVLETKLRQLCSSRGIPEGKLDRMNADLAKSGLYTLLVQKRITALADIRNNAAHGQPDKFNESDVQDFISYVERFSADYT
nr:DUF4145 domain-containing protein [Ancylobacter defluvii]